MKGKIMKLFYRTDTWDNFDSFPVEDGECLGCIVSYMSLIGYQTDKEWMLVGETLETAIPVTRPKIEQIVLRTIAINAVNMLSVKDC